jgi:hypothetical protein
MHLRRMHVLLLVDQMFYVCMQGPFDRKHNSVQMIILDLKYGIWINYWKFLVLQSTLPD